MIRLRTTVNVLRTTVYVLNKAGRENTWVKPTSNEPVPVCEILN